MTQALIPTKSDASQETKRVKLSELVDNSGMDVRDIKLNAWSLKKLVGATGVKHNAIMDWEGRSTLLYSWTTPTGEIFHETCETMNSLVLYRDPGEGKTLELVEESHHG